MQATKEILFGRNVHIGVSAPYRQEAVPFIVQLQSTKNSLTNNQRFVSFIKTLFSQVHLHQLKHLISTHLAANIVVLVQSSFCRTRVPTAKGLL